MISIIAKHISSAFNELTTSTHTTLESAVVSRQAIIVSIRVFVRFLHSPATVPGVFLGFDTSTSSDQASVHRLGADTSKSWISGLLDVGLGNLGVLGLSTRAHVPRMWADLVWMLRNGSKMVFGELCVVTATWNCPWVALAAEKRVRPHKDFDFLESSGALFVFIETASTSWIWVYAWTWLHFCRKP